LPVNIADVKQAIKDFSHAKDVYCRFKQAKKNEDRGFSVFQM
jgi:hypothetical protein